MIFLQGRVIEKSIFRHFFLNNLIRPSILSIFFFATMPVKKVKTKKKKSSSVTEKKEEKTIISPLEEHAAMDEWVTLDMRVRDYLFKYTKDILRTSFFL